MVLDVCPIIAGHDSGKVCKELQADMYVDAWQVATGNSSDNPSVGRPPLPPSAPLLPLHVADTRFEACQCGYGRYACSGLLFNATASAGPLATSSVRSRGCTRGHPRAHPAAGRSGAGGVPPPWQQRADSHYVQQRRLELPQAARAGGLATPTPLACLASSRCTPRAARLDTTPPLHSYPFLPSTAHSRNAFRAALHSLRHTTSHCPP